VNYLNYPNYKLGLSISDLINDLDMNPALHTNISKMKMSEINTVKFIYELEMRSVERGICPTASLTLCLTLYSLTGSRV